MPPVPVRKRLAGSDSFGHEWPKDGSVTEVEYDEALILLAIPDGGFSIADQPGDRPKPAPEPGPEVTEPEAMDGLSEVDPKSDDATDKPAARKTAARRTSKPQS